MARMHSFETSSMFPASDRKSPFDLVDGEVSRRFGLGSLRRLLASWRLQLSPPPIRRWSDRIFRRLPAPESASFLHLDEAQLLAYLDGELSLDARQQVSDHLQSCWNCRGMLKELRAHIRAFLAERESQLPDLSSLSEPRVRELRQRLAESVEKPPVDVAG